MAARRAQERAAALDDIADVLPFHLEHLFVQYAAIAVMDAPHLCSLEECCAHDGARRRIHTGAVAAARQNTDTIQHRKIPPITHDREAKPFPYPKENLSYIIPH